MNQIKLFKHPFLNKLIHTHPLIAIFLYYLISLAIVIYGIVVMPLNLVDGLEKLLILLGGILLFSLVEYCVHRFMYHSGEDYKDEKNWQYKVHGVHHEHPREKDLLALPIPLALALLPVFYLLFSWPMGNQVYFFFPGFLSGYASYLFIHYIIHTRQPPKNALGYLWKHHLKHHYACDDRAFGVSSPLWDYVFGTMPKKITQNAKKNA